MASSLNLLGLYTEGGVIGEKAIHSSAMQRDPRHWAAHVYRDRLSAAGRDPQLDVEEVEHLRRQVERWYQPGDDVGPFLIDLSVARAYLVRGHGDAAERHLLDLQRRMHTLSRIGSLHRAMLYARLASLYRRREAWEEWHHFLGQALGLAHRARLRRVQSELEAEHHALPGYRAVQAAVSSEPP